MRYQRERIFTNPGDPIHIIYSPKVSKTGSIELVESGKENTNDYIQSFVASTDIHVIIARIMNGEQQLLYSRPGSYGDFTKLPQTYAEALQLQIDSNNLFNSLPVEIKQKFDNDSSKFFASAGTEKWFKDIEPVLPDEVKYVIFPSSAPAPAGPSVDVSTKEE